MTNRKVSVFLFLFILVVFIIPFASSCGKGGNASAVGYNTQLEILNLSPDLQPVNLYIDFLQQGTTSYSYPISSGYFYLNSIDTPIQIRSSLFTTVNLFGIDSILLANHKYSLFITGLKSDTSYTYIFTGDDFTATPNQGFGKVRFVNASLPATNLNVLANNTIAFLNIKYKAVSPYVQIPAGNYNFQITTTATPNVVLSTPTLSTSTTIQDGRLYTLYSYGIINRTDTSAFGAALLTNR
jgi:hypothetical protein